ncbi:MAG: 3'-5' exonuclease domain-containing protein 2 [Bacteroidales bacterium]|nr:3'-5' exonuclease domain-containing protein 2 [Bacteroidales bacterium]
MYKSSISPEEIAALEMISFPGEIHVIEKQGKDFDDAVSYLSSKPIIGFDTETRPVFSPEQHSNGTALLQLSGKGKAFLFRLQKLGLPRQIAAILSNPDIIKVGAATADDIRGLQRIRLFKAAGFVDLQTIVGNYGITDKSVKKMTAIILGSKISKAQQLSNWEAPVLSASQQKYAATDAWVCLEMYMKLISHD